MAVKRIIANIRADRLEDARRFYADILDMDVVMDHGWIVTYASDGQMAPQISIACEGGAGTPVPDLSIEVDNLDGSIVVHWRQAWRSSMAPSPRPGASAASSCEILSDVWSMCFATNDRSGSPCNPEHPPS